MGGWVVHDALSSTAFECARVGRALQDLMQATVSIGSFISLLQILEEVDVITEP
jgi:hypothetical protein